MLFALAAIAASVSVDVSSSANGARAELDAGTLNGSLLLRLTEEGYTIRPSYASASYRLEVKTEARHLAVIVNGELPGQRIELSASAPVIYLEAAQRAVTMLRAATSGRSTRGADLLELVPAFVRFVGEPTRAAWLRGQLAVATVDAGLELVGAHDDARLVLCVVASDRRVSLGVARTAGACQDRTDVVVLRDEAMSHEAFTSNVVSQARTLLAAAASDPEAHEAPAPTLATREPASNVHAVVPARTRRPMRWELATLLGGSMRGTTIDPVVAVSFTAGRRWRAASLLTLSSASTDALDVIEGTAAAGVGMRLAASSLVLDLSLLVGVRAHRYRRTGEPSGQRLDWIVELPITISRKLTRSWSIAASALPSRSESAREHVTTTGVRLWQRSAWELGLLAGAGYQF